MKGLIRIIVLIVLIVGLNWFYPLWWSIMVLPLFLMTLFVRKPLVGFINGFVAGAFAWGIITLYQYFNGSELIAEKMAKVFGLPENASLMLLIVILLGALLAGLGGLTGASLRAVIKPEKKYIY